MPDWVAVVYANPATAESTNTPCKTVGVGEDICGVVRGSELLEPEPPQPTKVKAATKAKEKPKWFVLNTHIFIANRNADN
jgi:hypothetical protein